VLKWHCCHHFREADCVNGYWLIRGVETENINCKKAMAKLDFNHEGTMEDCELKNGKYISLDIYAKIDLGKQTQSLK